MEEREIRNLVKGWRDRSRRERDVVSKFVFLWFCFNAILAFESQKEADRTMINWLKSRPRSSRLISGYDAATRSSVFSGYLRALAANSPITDPRCRHRPVVIVDAEDFDNLLEGIYRIRCNLFHGRKSSNDVRDQKLIKVAALILEKWMGNVVSMWK